MEHSPLNSKPNSSHSSKKSPGSPTSIVDIPISLPHMPNDMASKFILQKAIREKKPDQRILKKTQMPQVQAQGSNKFKNNALERSKLLMANMEKNEKNRNRHKLKTAGSSGGDQSNWIRRSEMNGLSVTQPLSNLGYDSNRQSINKVQEHLNMFRTKPKTAPKQNNPRKKIVLRNSQQEMQIYNGNSQQNYQMPQVRASEIYKDTEKFKRPFTGASSSKTHDNITLDKTAQAFTERQSKISPKSSLNRKIRIKEGIISEKHYSYLNNAYQSKSNMGMQQRKRYAAILPSRKQPRNIQTSYQTFKPEDSRIPQTTQNSYLPLNFESANSPKESQPSRRLSAITLHKGKKISKNEVDNLVKSQDSDMATYPGISGQYDTGRNKKLFELTKSHNDTNRLFSAGGVEQFKGILDSSRTTRTKPNDFGFLLSNKSDENILTKTSHMSMSQAKVSKCYQFSPKRGIGFSPKQKSLMSQTGTSSIETRKSVIIKQPPHTDIPVIDQYYQSVDTLKEIGSIQFKSVFLRLLEKVDKTWKLWAVSKAERKRIKKQLDNQFIAVENALQPVSLPEQMALLDSIEKYIGVVNNFYKSKVSITNTYSQHQQVVKELIEFSRGAHDLTQFQPYGIRLIQKLRNMTLSLFSQIRGQVKHVGNPQSPFFTTDNECITCAILEDRCLQTKGGIVIRKLRFFLENFIFFMPKADDRVNRELALVLRKMQKELYSPIELGLFKKLKDQLEPSVRDITRIKSYQNYLGVHCCTKEQSQNREIIFNFDIMDITDKPLINFQEDGETITSEVEVQMDQMESRFLNSKRLKGAIDVLSSHSFSPEKSIVPSEAKEVDRSAQSESIGDLDIVKETDVDQTPERVHRVQNEQQNQQMQVITNKQEETNQDDILISGISQQNPHDLKAGIDLFTSKADVLTPTRTVNESPERKDIKTDQSPNKDNFTDYDRIMGQSNLTERNVEIVIKPVDHQCENQIIQSESKNSNRFLNEESGVLNPIRRNTDNTEQSQLTFPMKNATVIDEKVGRTFELDDSLSKTMQSQKTKTIKASDRIGEESNDDIKVVFESRIEQPSSSMHKSQTNQNEINSSMIEASLAQASESQKEVGSRQEQI